MSSRQDIELDMDVSDLARLKRLARYFSHMCCYSRWSCPSNTRRWDNVGSMLGNTFPYPRGRYVLLCYWDSKWYRFRLIIRWPPFEPSNGGHRIINLNFWILPQNEALTKKDSGGVLWVFLHSPTDSNSVVKPLLTCFFLFLSVNP